MLSDYQGDLGELFPRGFGKNVTTASAMGAVGTVVTLVPSMLLGTKLVDARANPRKAVLTSALTMVVLGTGLGRLLYTRQRVAALGFMGGALGTAAIILAKMPFVSDDELKAAAASGGVRGLSLSELIQGESEGLYPGNYAYP